MKFALTTLGLVTSTTLEPTEDTTTLLSTASIEDDSVMLSVASVRKAIAANQASSMSALVDFAQADSPRKASALLQSFAKATVDRGEAVDEPTKAKLEEIAAQLTNNTWMSLEQAHRRDQDRISKHWEAIKRCGDKHVAHMQQDVDSLEVRLVRTLESDMLMCRGLPDHKDPTASLLGDLPADYDTTAWLKTLHSAYHIAEDGHRYFAHASAKYNDENYKSLMDLKAEVCEKCGALDNFLKNLHKSRPACDAPLLEKEMSPQCWDMNEKPLVDSDLDEYFSNLHTFASNSLETFEKLDKACTDARNAYDAEDEQCDEEQTQYEMSFCDYRQGLHATCAEYQGCHIMSEDEYKKLIADVMYAADSRKIDWKAIHKIACYIKVLVSDGTNDERNAALTNCESGDLNTLATILTGFNETNYMSIIVPDISGNVSCWDLDVPPLIDFKECDMTSVAEYPCTETWEDRYNGLESPAACTECNDLPNNMQYYANQSLGHEKHARLDAFGGGWLFVNELGHSEEDMNDVYEHEVMGYHLPEYSVKNLRWNEVLVRRLSANWCDSWDRDTKYWAQDGGASMCVQSDHEHVYCMNNAHGGHSWRQQPVSHFGSICGKNGMPDCECWPFKEGESKLCFDYTLDQHVEGNVEAPKHVQIHPMTEDGSVVKIQFHGEEKKGVLRLGNYGAFLGGVGCKAVEPVRFQVFVRCLGCTTERTDFHTKDGAQFVMPMTVGQMSVDRREKYTYEAWVKSPLEGDFIREIFGGGHSGFSLVNDGKVACEKWGNGVNERTSYHLKVGNSNAYSSMCFQKNMFYHVAATRCPKEGVKLYVNGRQVTKLNGESAHSSDSVLARSFGGGFTDGGQLFNVRIWNYARSQADILEYSAVTDKMLMDDLEGIDHWWPLTDGVKDIMTGTELDGDEVRYSPIWCSDLEASGMRVC